MDLFTLGHSMDLFTLGCSMDLFTLGCIIAILHPRHHGTKRDVNTRGRSLFRRNRIFQNLVSRRQLNNNNTVIGKEGWNKKKHIVM